MTLFSAESSFSYKTSSRTILYMQHVDLISKKEKSRAFVCLRDLPGGYYLAKWFETLRGREDALYDLTFKKIAKMLT